jgi:hypothetical protein
MVLVIPSPAYFAIESLSWFMILVNPSMMPIIKAVPMTNLAMKLFKRFTFFMIKNKDRKGTYATKIYTLSTYST